MTIPGVRGQGDEDRAVARTYYGKYPGLVVDRAPANDAGHHRGELLVRVPGILEEDPSGGQRPLETVAKPCFTPGLFWIPELEDTVWVEFVAGDINHPIWTGVWYPSDTTPETTDGDRPTEDQRVLRTPAGHVLYFDDTGGSEQLVLEDANANVIQMDADGIKLEAGQCSIVMDGSTIRITNGVHTLEMGSAGTTLDHAGLGAEGLVLAPVIDWLLSHQHTGNMAAPTPLFPADLAMLQVPVPPKKSVS